jgi:hypothetical protein
MPKLSGLIYGEGGKDRKVLQRITEMEKFRYYSKNWHFNFGNASGGSPKTILQKCKKKMMEADYQLTICFIDLDVLKSKYPKKWGNEVKKLEEEFSEIKIFWQEDCLEDELFRVLGNKNLGKKGINKLARKRNDCFVNSKYWKRLIDIIEKSEKEFLEKPIKLN